VKAKKHGAGLQIRNAAGKPFLYIFVMIRRSSSAEETCAAGDQEEQASSVRVMGLRRKRFSDIWWPARNASRSDAGGRPFLCQWLSIGNRLALDEI
jgi:hypothetical protein